MRCLCGHSTALTHAGLRGDVRGDWDELKQHDVVFLVTVRPPDEVALAALRDSGAEPTPADLYGLVCVRGAEVIEVCPLPPAIRINDSWRQHPLILLRVRLNMWNASSFI